ncbi:MAG: VOC family protein [Anaerolineae bacterium]|nr:VOC family protein [Anaerolineae bacterium]
MADEGLGSTTVVQIGIVVRDIEEKARAWAELLGLPVPQIVVTDPPEKAHTEHRGRPTAARARLAFFQAGQVSIELIEPLGSPSTWQEQLEQHGDSLHHVAFVIKGMAERAAYLQALGIPLVQRGEYTGGRYAYFDGVDRLGTVLELLEDDW